MRDGAALRPGGEKFLILLTSNDETATVPVNPATAGIGTPSKPACAEWPAKLGTPQRQIGIMRRSTAEATK